MNIISRTLTVLAAASILVAGGPTRSDATVIEAPEHTVSTVQVTYAEPMPTTLFGNRHYFETNDGAAYMYPNYRRCAKANDVPNRVCRTVFFYAR